MSSTDTPFMLYDKHAVWFIFTKLTVFGLRANVIGGDLMDSCSLGRENRKGEGD